MQSPVTTTKGLHFVNNRTSITELFWQFITFHFFPITRRYLMKSSGSGLIFWLVKSAVVAVACMVFVGISPSISMAYQYNASGTYSYVAGSPGSLIMTWSNSDFVCDGPDFPVMSKTVTSITATQMVWLNNPDTTLVRPNGTAGNITGTWTATDSTTGSTYSMVFSGTAASGTVSIAGAISICGSNGPPTITSFSPASGKVGSLVTIDGSNFSPILSNNGVMFNGVSAVVTGAQSGHLFALVPSGATTGTISVTTSGVTATSSSSFTATAGTPAATMAWGGVHHRLDSNGTVFDALDVGISSYASTLSGMTLSVAGPNGFSYTFIDADINRHINGQLTVYKKYVSPATLVPGVYTYTLDDGRGHISHRVDTHVTVANMLQVDSATIQLQRKPDGSYLISWAALNDTKTYYYRVRINRNDAANTPVYDSQRTMASFAEVPTGILFDDSMYKLRVEAVDSPNSDLATNRSLSAWKLFNPQGADSAGMLSIDYVGAYNWVNANGTQSTMFDFGVCDASGVNCNATILNQITSAEIFAPDGSLYYTFKPSDKFVGYNEADYYKLINPAPSPGTYKFHFVANGVSHYAYSTLTSPVVYPVPDVTTYQANTLSNGSIRFSWADVNYTGALYYRIQAYDANSSSNYAYYSSRANQAYVDVPKTDLNSIFGDVTSLQWRVEVCDSTSFNTQRNRTNGPWATTNLASLPAYDPSKPVINNIKVFNMNLPDGTSATRLFILAADTGTITERRVDGPNGYSRILTTPDVYVPGAYSLTEPGSPAVGLYTLTAVDNDNNSVVRYNFQPAPKIMDPVDYHTFQAGREPNGDLRISWAPIVSDVPLWYSLEMYDANTLSSVTSAGVGSIVPLSSVTVPAAYVPSRIMFRIVAVDGSTTTTYNNGSRSVMVGYQPGVNYAILTDADGDGYASNIDPDDSNAAIDPFWSTTASGTYTYPVSASSGTLTWTFDTSNFVCDGPKFGTETVTVTGLTATTMTWADSGGNMIWTRPSGTAGDISGTWSISDPDTGSSYKATFSGGVVSLVATVIRCGTNGTPTITSFVPSPGVTGNLITINGSNFSPIATNNAVTFNGTPAVVTGVRPGQLFAVVPPGASSGSIRVTNLGGTALSGTPFTVSSGSAAVILNSGGVSHRLDSDGTEFDAFDALVGTYATTLTGMSLSVVGPGNFTYTFSDADIIQYVNGQILVYKKYPTGTLPEGVYTYTLIDGQGTVSHRVDTHVVGTGALPQVDSATIQMQRKVDGSYRFSWAPVKATKTYYYRVRINRNDAAGTYIYDSARAMAAFADVPPGILFDDSMYKIRVETVDSPNGDLATNRSLSAWKLFSPKMGDYNPNQLLTNYAVVNNRTNFGASQSFDAILGVSDASLVTSISLTGPAGFTPYNFIVGTDVSFTTTNGTTNTKIFYKNFTGTMPTGLYTFTYQTQLGGTQTAYATLTAPVTYAIVDLSTMQAQDLNNGNIRYSWASVDHTGALYYRVVLNGTTQYSTPRQNQTFVDIPKSIVTGTVYPFSNWRVEVYDSPDITTQRNRFHSNSKSMPFAPYDPAAPLIDYYFLYNMNLLDVSTAALYLIGAHDSDGNITQRRVDGPNGFTRNTLTRDPSFPNAFSLIETGSPAAGLYTLTALDSTGKNSVRYKYQTSPHAIPAVDYHTFQVDLEPNGAPRISWAPVVSDVPIWYYLEIWNVDTMTPVVLPTGNVASTTMQQTSVSIPSQYMQGQVMFRIFALDGSDGSTINNASVSVMVKYQPGFTYAGLTDADHDGYASNIDAIDSNPNIDPFHPTASGTYTYNTGSGLLSMNWVSSNFICDGPTLGAKSETVTSLTATAMSWQGGMTWSRASGTVGDILGTWSSTEPSTGNVYTITFSADGSIAVSSSIISCSGANLPTIAVPQATIQVDGAISDWAAITPMITDPAGDADYTGLDITGVSMAQDAQNIYFRVDRVGNNLPSNEYSNFWIFLNAASPGKKSYGINFFHSSPTQHDANLMDISANPDDYNTWVTLSSNVTNVFTDTTIEFSIPKNLITVENEFILSFFTHHTLSLVWQSASDVPGNDVKVTQLTSQPANYPLTLTFAGAGSGSVNSSPSGIACTGNSCPPANFSPGTVVTLSAVADAGSTFSGWPVPPCIVNVNGNCDVTMNGSKNITATFYVNPLSRISHTGIYYGLLAHAFAAASTVSTDTIEARDVTFIENLILNRPVSVFFKGGFSAGFGSNSGGFTNLDGKLTINAGRLTIQGLKIK